MDQLVSQLLPTQRIGNDGFNWWVGQIEGTAADETNNKGGYRFKVRIVGDHPGDPELVATEDLPWASVMMPVNVPFIPGNGGGGHPQLEVGCWVVGFYLDTEKQKPIIMGSIGQTPGATKVYVERTDSTPPFTTAIPQVNVAVDGEPLQKKSSGATPAGGGETQAESGTAGESKNTATGGLSDGTKDGDGNERVNTPARKTVGENDEDWCQAIAEKCTNQDLNQQMTIILGEFLAEVQKNNGNIGSYLVDQVSGGLNSGVDIARKYVNKAISVVEHFIAKIKGFVIDTLTDAVDALIKALIYPSEEGNILTPVTQWFNDLLKDLGCQMADLGDRLAEWLTDVLMSYVEQIYKSIACQVDALVNGIISKINELLEDILGSVLGPIQEILGAIAAPLNIIGGAINYILDLLGISCSGPNTECSRYKELCTNGQEKADGDEDFLDGLLKDIDNLFPSTGADYTQYVCDEAYKGNTLDVTTVGFTGGVPLPNETGARVGIGVRRITYDISDIEVTEGETAEFVVTRSGQTSIASSVRFKTLTTKGTATEGSDYLKQSGILGFAPGETSKVISVQTLYSSEVEEDEYFYVKLTRNSPIQSRRIGSFFVNNVAKCTIIERDTQEEYDPFSPGTVNPIDGIEETFPEEVTTVDPPTNAGEGEVDQNTGSNTPTYSVFADKSVVREGEFVVYTVNTTNVADGTLLYYTLTGNGITSDDIIGGATTGKFRINNNTAKITVGINDDGVVEEEETLRFTINGIGAATDVLITTNINDDSSGEGPDDLGDFDEGEGETPENSFDDEFRLPTVDPGKIITDPGGGIIEIPIDDPGDPWAEPPYIFIGGEGKGAAATPLLDQNGFITEIRIKSSGFGYKLNTPQAADVRCIIDTFTVIRPGINYSERPTILVDGRSNVAEAIINDDGFVIGARTLDRRITFDKFPKIEIIGGGGYGAKLLPSLACLDTDGLTTIGSTKIGTGRYVDCP
jgi:hypothetical protein